MARDRTARSSYPPPRPDTRHEGVIVWDHKGIVLMWADGHRSRFSWTALRAACACNDCRQQQAQDFGLAQYAA